MFQRAQLINAVVLAKRNIFRILVTFNALVLLQFTIELLTVPLFYIYNLIQYGWQLPSFWYLQYMAENSNDYLVNYSLLALLLTLVIEFFRASFLALKMVARFTFKKFA